MSLWLLRIWYLGRKELLGFLNDAALIVFTVYSFSLAVYSDASGARVELSDTPVAIVDQDGSELSRRLRDALQAPLFRAPVSLEAAEIEAALRDGTFSFILEIPPGLQRDVLSGRSAEAMLHLDATAMSVAGTGANYIESIVQDETERFLEERGLSATLPFEPVIRALFNPNLKDSWTESVTSIVEKISLLSLLLVGAAVMRERERGTLEHLLVLPLGAAQIALSKILANALVILAATALSVVLVVRLALEVPLAGSLPLFLAGTLLYLFAMMSLGVLIATVANSMPQFALLTVPAFIVIHLLSGATTPLESMPPALQTLLLASPATQYVRFAQSVLYRGADLGIVWPQLVAIAGIGSLLLVIALRRFRGMLARQA